MVKKTLPRLQKYIFNSKSPAGTASLGRRLGSLLPAGSILAFTGELGCGKTLLVKGICTGLGVPHRQVSSPTFILVNEYQGRLPIYHMDLYRINTPDVFEIGLLDYLNRAEKGVLLVEWAEKILTLLPESRLRIDFTVRGKNERRIEISAPGGKFESLFEELGQA